MYINNVFNCFQPIKLTMSRRFGSDGEGKLALRRENLRSAVEGFKDALDHGRNPAPPGMKLDARTALWEFAEIRQEADAETEAIAGYFREGRTRPSDHELRVARVCLARYLVDKLGELAGKCGESGKSAPVSLFFCARDSVKELLDTLYFFKSREAIIDAYLQAEPALVSCAEALGVPLLSLEEAHREYGKMLADAVNRINGLH